MAVRKGGGKEGRKEIAQSRLVGLQGTLAFPPGEVGAMEGSEQRRDSPDSGVCRHPPETAEAVFWGQGGQGGSQEAREVTTLVQVSHDGACTGRWHLETSDLASISVAGSTALAGT